MYENRELINQKSIEARGAKKPCGAFGNFRNACLKISKIISLFDGVHVQ